MVKDLLSISKFGYLWLVCDCTIDVRQLREVAFVSILRLKIKFHAFRVNFGRKAKPLRDTWLHNFNWIEEQCPIQLFTLNSRKFIDRAPFNRGLTQSRLNWNQRRRRNVRSETTLWNIRERNFWTRVTSIHSDSVETLERPRRIPNPWFAGFLTTVQVNRLIQLHRYC